MANTRHIICGGLRIARDKRDTNDPLRLNLRGKMANTRLRVSDLTKGFVANIHEAFLDLIEIATYIYVADQAVKRGSYKLDDMGDRWRRELIFDIPVRCLDLWTSAEITRELESTLSFLSDDVYEFRFHEYRNAPSPEAYFPFGKGAIATQPARVVLFSGGLDSLGGAIEEITQHSEPISFLTHEPSKKFRPRQRLLRQHLNERAAGPKPWHVTVEINKSKTLNKEYTQRSRSFLYASLAAAVATMAGLPGIRFYENGVISINLPIADDVLGGRATRTTHPRVLNGFERLFTALSGERFTVENGFLWKTKTDVVRGIVDAGFGNLIETATSCTHTWQWTKQWTHCGVCSQCVDRRFAVLAAQAEAFDPSNRYRADLLLTPRPGNEPRRLLASYVEMARQVGLMSKADFKETFGDIYRVAAELPGPADENIDRIFDLYQRHGREVGQALRTAISANGEMIANGESPANSLLQLVHDMSVPANGMVSASVPSADPSRETVPNFFFRREGEVWRYRFDGNRTRTLLPSRGASYLHVLLSSPGTEFSVGKLVLEVAKNPVQYHFSSGDEVLDDEARHAIWSEYQDYARLIEDAEKHNREGEVAQLRKEQAKLLSEMNKAGFKKTRKRLGDDTERHRKAVGMALKRVRDKIREFDEEFAEHLKRQVRTGRHPRYLAPDGVEWITA